MGEEKMSELYDKFLNWIDNEKINKNELDAVLEFLHDKGCLTPKGRNLMKEFWEKQIQDKQSDDTGKGERK